MLAYIKSFFSPEKKLNTDLAVEVLSTLNKDVARKILLELEDDKDLLQICNLQVAINKNICDDVFFYNRLQQKYPKLNKFGDMNWKEFYLFVIYYVGLLEEEYNFTFSKNSEKIPNEYYNVLKSGVDLQDTIDRAAGKGLKDLLQFLLEGQDLNNFLFEFAFLQAVESNHIPTIGYILDISGNVDFNIALYKSALNKNKKLIDYFLREGADVNYGLEGAVKTGDINWINYFTEKEGITLAGLNQALYTSVQTSVQTGNMDIINHIISLGADDFLTASILTGDMKLKNFFYEKMKNK